MPRFSEATPHLLGPVSWNTECFWKSVHKTRSNEAMFECQSEDQFVIAVTDDNPAIAGFVAGTLRMQGYQVL
jgi:hypothetical protein